MEAEGYKVTWWDKFWLWLYGDRDASSAPPVDAGGSLVTGILGNLVTLISSYSGPEDAGAALATKASEQITSETNVQTWKDATEMTTLEALAYILDPVIPDWFNINDVGKDIATESDEQVTSETNKTTWKDALKETVNDMLDNMLSAVVPDWFFTNDFGGKIATEADTQVRSESVVGQILKVGVAFVESIGAGMLNKISWLGGIINQLIQDAIAWFLAHFEHSPIEVFFDLGKTFAESISAGIIDGAEGIGRGLAKSAKMAAMYSSKLSATAGSARDTLNMRSTTRGAPVTARVTNIRFGDVYIRDSMDWATFKGNVHRAIIEGG
jgi:hypothetical protein